MKKTSKKDTEEQIGRFFSGIKDKTPEEVKRIKKLAMSHNIKLKKLRKTFCRKCLAPYSGNEKTKIRGKIKSIECRKCSYVSRWKMKD